MCNGYVRGFAWLSKESVTKTLHIPMLGFVNVKAGGNLSRSKTLHTLLPTAYFLTSTVAIAIEHYVVV